MIAITGARGLLGATLMRTIPDAVAIESDIQDREAVLEEVKRLSNMTHIIHAAALTNTGECERNPELAHQINGEGTRHVVDAARECGARVFYISTVSVFSGEHGNYREEDIPQPINVHNRTKVEGERHVAAYESGTIVRLNLIGIHPDGSRGMNFMEWIYDSLMANKDMTAFEDVRINPLSNWSIARMLDEMARSTSTVPVVHLGSSDVVSKADIVERVAAHFPSYRGTITRGSVESIADGVVRPKEMWLNTDYTKESLGLTMPSIENEISTIFAHLHA